MFLSVDETCCFAQYHIVSWYSTHYIDAFYLKLSLSWLKLWKELNQHCHQMLGFTQLWEVATRLGLFVFLAFKRVPCTGVVLDVRAVEMACSNACIICEGFSMLFDQTFSVRGGVNFIKLVWFCDVHIMWHAYIVENFTLVVEVLPSQEQFERIKIPKKPL